MNTINKRVSLKSKPLSYWQLANALEEGRNQVLRMVARNDDLAVILDTLCHKAQLYNTQMLCSILRLDSDAGTLHPIASVSLPAFYCDALEGVHIGAGVGSCGTAAFLKERVIVEDINTHPYWSQYKGLALEAGVEACWSEPIIGAEGIVYGTFAMYYRKPKKPCEEDLKFIELSANLAAVVFENNSNREKLLLANAQLSQTIDQRNHQLEQVNSSLEKALKQQKEHHQSHITSEKIITTNSLICGLSHELNTPIGNALTAISTAEDKLTDLNSAFISNTLTRNEFVKKITELNEIAKMNRANLERAINLITRFREVNVADNVEDIITFDFQHMFTEFRTGITSMLGRHKIHLDCHNIQISCAKLSLCQVLLHLIENSIEHGFTAKELGLITINVTKNTNHVVIDYQDDGVGLDEEQKIKIFEPFYSSKRNKKHVGLGLIIVSNIITHVMKGTIELIPSPIGVRYKVLIPNVL